MEVKVSKDKHISRWADQQNLIVDANLMLDEIESKTVHSDQEGDR